MIFYLGTHETSWLGRTDVPLFVSARRLRLRRQLPKALGPWALDSGGFTELNKFGHWETNATQYAAEVRRWRDEIGNLQWAAIQDWMCEPFVLAKTGLSVEQHQILTINSWVALNAIDGSLPWVPVLQGYRLADYVRHVEMYRTFGATHLDRLPLVGLGSVCRRQGMREAEDIVRELSAMGIRLHGFGFKLTGLARCAEKLASSDSMAWSRAARYKPPLAGCRHKTCANCLRFALRWRERVLRTVAHPRQLRLF